MAPIGSVSDFIDALQASQVLEASQLDEVSRELLAQHDDVRTLAEALVQRAWLTPYQADLLFNGRGHELVLGPYRLLDLLGEGGMGQVFKARHQRLHRVVALKVIRQERLSTDPEVVRRFQREAQAAAQMSHPNVVLVYDADQVDNTHFIAMEYVEGIDLAKLVKDLGPLPARYACEYIRQAALGLQHAHERGLVHRDIKPSNLFVTRPASRPSSGPAETASKDEVTLFGLPSGSVVKILDMGLARLTETASNAGSNQAPSFHTQAGTVMGTPDFIAPEQARNASSVDHRADLYSLGCTLYYLLAGQPPFAEGSVVEKLLMHQLDDPRPIEELQPNMPPRVAAIVRKLMAKKPADRYQTAQEVVEELAEIPYSGNTLSLIRAAPVREEETSGTTDATAVVKVTPVAPAPPAADKGSRREDDADRPKRIAALKGHRGWVISTAFSFDRALLASGGVDGSIRLWGFSSQVPKEVVLPETNDGEVHALDFSPDTRTLASSSGTLDGIIRLWDLTDLRAPRNKALLQGHKAPVAGLAFSPDGKMLASASLDCSLRLWDVADAPRERAVLWGHGDFVQSARFAPDGKTVASGGQDGTVRLWNIGKLWSSEQAVLHGHTGPVRSVAFSPDGKLLASASLDQTVHLWDLSHAQPRRRAILRGHGDPVRLVLFPPDGQSLVSVGNGGRIILWNLADESKQREWNLPSAMASSVAFTFDGRYTAFGKSDGSVDVFRLYARKKDQPE